MNNTITGKCYTEWKIWLPLPWKTCHPRPSKCNTIWYVSHRTSCLSTHCDKNFHLIKFGVLLVQTRMNRERRILGCFQIPFHSWYRALRALFSPALLYISGFYRVLQTLWRMVVFPPFARPIMRIRKRFNSFLTLNGPWWRKATMCELFERPSHNNV